VSPTGWIHTALALVALASGAFVLLRPKGTARHRRVGWVYVGSMIALNLTALLIYRLSGGFGPFHGAALVSIATVAGGVAASVRRRPGWLERHYYWMGGSFIGLLAAAASEAATRLPRTPFWWMVAAASAAVVLPGSVLLVLRAGPTLRGVAVTDRRSAEFRMPGPRRFPASGRCG
jgi:uncharacterized membrane protein